MNEKIAELHRKLDVLELMLHLDVGKRCGVNSKPCGNSCTPKRTKKGKPTQCRKATSETATEWNKKAKAKKLVELKAERDQKRSTRKQKQEGINNPVKKFKNKLGEEFSIEGRNGGLFFSGKNGGQALLNAETVRRVKEELTALLSGQVKAISVDDVVDLENHDYIQIKAKAASPSIPAGSLQILKGVGAVHREGTQAPQVIIPLKTAAKIFGVSVPKNKRALVL